MKKHTVLLFAIFLLNTAAFRPDPPEAKLSVADVLRGVQRDKNWQSSQQMVEFASLLDYRLPVVKSLGLRFGADDFTDASLRYGLSFSFNPPAQRRWQAMGNKAMGVFYSAEREVVFNREISDCYRNIVDFYCAGLLLSKNQHLDSLLQLRQEALKIALEKGLSVRARDLVETEDDLREASLAIQQSSNRLAHAQKRLSFLTGSTDGFRLAFSNFISEGTIETVLAGLQVNRTPGRLSPNQKAAQSQLILEKLNLKILEAADRQIFDGFQVNHKVSGNALPGEGVSVRFGVNIPIRGNSNPRRNKILLDVKQAENEFELLSHEQDKEFRAQVQIVEGLLAEYRSAKTWLASSLALKVLDSPTLKAGLSATDVVDLRILQQKKGAEIVKIYDALLREYVNLMEMTGELVALPLRNYLSEGLERL